MRFCAPILILREPAFTVIVPVVQLVKLVELLPVSLLLKIWLFRPVTTTLVLSVNSAEVPTEPMDTLLFIVTVVDGAPLPKDTVLALPAVMVVFVRSSVPTRLTLPDTVNNVVIVVANLLISVSVNVKFPVTLIVFWEDVLMTVFVIAKSPVMAMVPPPSIVVVPVSGVTVMPLITAI